MKVSVRGGCSMGLVSVWVSERSSDSTLASCIDEDCKG